MKVENELVSGVPEIKEYHLCPDDQFIIIASDGLWDTIDNQEAVNIVKKHMSNSKVCDILAKRAIRRGSRDNITVVVIWLNWVVQKI